MLSALLILSPAQADPVSDAHYVKLIDRAGYTDSPSTPGADIDAVELLRGGVSIGFAEAVIEEQIGLGLYGNAATASRAALGAPDHPPRTREGFVSLGGPGNFLVLRLGSGARLGDTIRVYESGARGGRPEHTEVCVALSPDGPWRSLGSGWSTFDVAVASAPETDPDAVCRSVPLI